MKPSFLIIGAQKSGTTALADALGGHPGVFVCEPREPEYFSHSVRPDRAGMSWEAYQALFLEAGEDQAGGEASTGTMLRPDVIPEIDRRLPGVRLIAVLREPVGRAYSGMAHDTKKGRVAVGEGAGIFEKEAQAFLAGEDCQFDWFSRSEYGRQLEPFARHYGERLKIVIFEELIAEQERVLGEVLEFLELPPAEIALTRENTTRVPKGRATEALVAMGRRVVGPVRRSMSEKGYRKFREGIMQKLGKRIEPLDPELAGRLRAEGFAEDREILKGILGRSVEVWKQG